MTITDIVTVTVAPGQTVTISPHPSGIPELGPLTLHAGESLTVTGDKADRLWEDGRILHPVTGQAKLKQPRDPHPAPTITYGNGRPIPISDQAALIPASMRAERDAVAAYDKAEEERQDRERLANGQGQERRVAVRVTHPTGSMGPLGPIAGITPEEGGWA
jgi:hypothetical protein